ncbi:alpha-acetolactate decarboxylase [Naviculisporaceae sp. PSN 640]
MAKNEFYQYSIITALMDGVASSGIPISTILENGDHGLGTFINMVGEMIVLDGEVYQMKADGSIIHISSPSTTLTPFACVTNFEPTCRSKACLKGDDLKQEINALLDSHFANGRNHILAFRLEGSFKTVRVRTAGGQIKPRESMIAVVERQTAHTFENVRGAMIGFRSPEWVTGLNVVGHHLHFISDDRQRGGHVLGLETDGEVEVQVSLLKKFHMEVPTEGDFNEAGLVVDAEGIAACEA